MKIAAGRLCRRTDRTGPLAVVHVPRGRPLLAAVPMPGMTYSSKAIRDALADRKIKAAIPIKDDHARARQAKAQPVVDRPASISIATVSATPWSGQ